MAFKITDKDETFQKKKKKKETFREETFLYFKDEEFNLEDNNFNAN